MYYASTLLFVLQVIVSSLSESVFVTVTGNLSNDSSKSLPDLRSCTSNESECYLELNDLGTKLSNFTSLSISFEQSSNVFVLHTRLHFQNYTQLELHGTRHKKTIITCTQKNDGLGVGLLFRNVSNFYASNIIFKKCGYQHRYIKFNKLLWSALVFDTCENVRLASVAIQESTGFGVSMIDTIGDIHFNGCLFSSNSAIFGNTDSGGGGVYLETTSSSHSSNTRGVYKLLNCTFMNNRAHTSSVYPRKKEVRTFGQGGGLLISFKGSTSSHHFTLCNCTFINNSAVWGGGLHLFFTDSSRNNTVFVENSLFKENKATAGGGGMVVYMVSHTSCIFENNINVVKSTFIKNQANSQGGGTIIHSLISSNTKNCNVKNYLRFESCTWRANAASYSGAVDITTRVTITESFPIVPVFSNCVFKSNKISNVSLAENSKYGESLIGKAALMVLGSIIKFENSVYFKRNHDTALYAIASEIAFLPNTNATFVKNRGRNGGAIALFSSTLFLGNYSRLNFTGNRAYEFGGAIYSETQGEHELHRNIHSLNCFIHCQYCDSVTLSFGKNAANSLETDDLGYSFGRSIYARSFLSCASRETVSVLTNKTANVSAFLDSIGNFKFIGSNPFDEVVSSAANFTLSKQPETLIIPGKEFYVPLVTIDSFGHKIQSDYKAFLRYRACSNGSITIDPKHIYLPTNKLKLYGDPGSKCSISIEREGSRLFYLSFKISIAQCPPGYILTNSEQVKSSRNYSTMECVCAHQVANGIEMYRGISNCNNYDLRVKILYYYWVGYESNDASHDNLVTAYCPHSFCTYNTSSYAYEYTLPGIANKSILDKFVCQNGRTGKICGSCKMNYSVYFHSPNFHCRKNYLCSVGWLFYLLSEIFTLILLFIIILCFNISFTTGTLNGFVFYAQIIDVLRVATGYQRSNYIQWTTVIAKASIFIYHFFNLNFFHLDSLSFCLWEGATTLDIITMKYLTIVLAFALLLFLFVFMNLCTFGNLKYYSKRLQASRSVIHGISTFLVICFAQTVKITFQIIAPGFVLKKGDKISSYQVQYDGDVQLFSIIHLKYVIPALFLFLSIVAVPTFFLMCYPLGFKALYKCGVNETKITKLNQIFCIIRLRPLFDSFQGCYKDKYRCFAGLYFIYRVLILASNSFSYGATQFYVLIQIETSLMLLIHCLSRPYKKEIHNSLDTLFFTNIAIINGLSIFIHTKSIQPLYGVIVNIASIFQALLIGLPLVLLLLYTAVKIVSKAKVCKSKRGDVVTELEDDQSIPFRLLEDSQSQPESNSYEQDQ